MDVYNEDITNDKKHEVLSKLWTDYYKLSEKYNIKLDFAYQLYLIGESESYIIKEEPKRFIIDENRLDDAIDSLKKGNDLTNEEIEILLQASVMNARRGFETLGIDTKNNSLNGFCELGQALSLMPLENIGLEVTKNSATGSFDYPFNHAFGTVTFPYNGATKTYLIDTTYRQFFTTNRCNEGRYYQEEENTGLKVAPDPGYFVEDKDFEKRFKFHSAAKSVHHGFVGGLLEHTLSVTKNCDYFAATYPILNRDLIVSAAIFHDIGKLEELSTFPENDYTDEGQLLGHIMIGAEMVGERIRTIPGFPKGTANELKHCILAHHGELEYGSPKKPALAEALALSFADNIDAKMETIREIFASVPENNLEWQGYNRLLESNIRRSGRES